MLYPRTVVLSGKEVLVEDNQMVSYREHLTQERRILFLSGVLTSETESHNLLMALDSLSDDPITLVITSPGGDLDSAFLFYDTIKMIKAPVITVGRFCASAAALLLAAGSPRYLFPHAKVMLHMATGQAGGDVKDWQIQHQQMEKYQNKVIDILRDNGVRKSREEILIDIDRDFWLEPEGAIEYGLADKIMTPGIWQGFLKDGH